MQEDDLFFLLTALGVWLYGIGAGTETDLYGNPSGRRTGSTAKEKGTEKEKKGGDVNVVKKKAIRMGIVTVVMIVLGAAAAVWYKMYR